MSCGGAVPGTCTNGSCGNCGGPGQPCCNGNPNGGRAGDFCTAAGLTCVEAGGGGSVCSMCGGPGQPCCGGTTCDAGGCCNQDPNTPTCIAAGQACPDNLGMCTNGGCQGGTCGLVGQRCCAGDVECTGTYTRCADNFCEPCGGSAQRCCDGGQNDDFCASGFVCIDQQGNRCARCGGAGQPCCAGDICSGGRTCGGNRTCN